MKTFREGVHHNLNIIWLYCVFNGKADLIPYSKLRKQCCHCWAQARGRKLHWINEDRLAWQFVLPLTTVTWWTLPPPGTNSRGSEYPAGGAGRGLAAPSLFQSPTAAVPLLQICLFYHPVQHTQWWLTKELNLGSSMTKHRCESHEWNHFDFASYLPRCGDNGPSIGVAFKNLCEFTQEVNAHFNCIEVLFALSSIDGGGGKKCRQWTCQAVNHWREGKKFFKVFLKIDLSFRHIAINILCLIIKTIRL